MNPLKHLPKVFIFDVGDTLFHVLDFNFNNFLDYFYNNIIDKSNVSFDEFIEYTKSIHHVFTDRGTTNMEVDFESYFNLLTFVFGNNSNLDFDTIEYNSAHAMYHGIKVKDIDLFLDLLEEMKIPKYVLSNSMFSTKEITRELKDFKLNERFNEILSTGDKLFRKPSDDIFNAYIKKLELLGYKKEDICYIGNSFRWDIETPIKLGINAIHFNINLNCDFISHDDYLEVNSYKSLTKLFKENF